jgi:autotransporter family porin
MNPEKIPMIIMRAFAGTVLPLLLASFLCGQPITWTDAAGDGSWLGGNWKTTSATGTIFQQGDIVNFDGSHGADGAITIDTLTSATVAGMYVSGNHSYSITGTSIIADPNAGAGAASSGKLILGARAADTTSIATAVFTGTLDLTGQGAGAVNNFAGGVEINSGALRISSTGQLGTTPGNVRFTGTGALLAAGNMTFDGAGAATHRLTLGGGVSGTIALDAGVTFAVVNSISGANGGVFFLDAGARLDLVAGSGANFLFDSNTGGSGGVIYGTGAVIFIDSGSFNNNRSSNIGGVILGVSSTMTVQNSVFTNNASGATNHGGAIANQGGTLGVTNALFASNTAGATSGGMGGGIFNNTGATTTVTGGTFRGNHASNAGGAVAAQSPSTVYATDVLFASNTATNQGGAIYLAANSVVSVTNARFQDNTAASNVNGGGAISNNNGTLSVTNALFQSNTAGSGMGGAISNNQTTASATIQSATFSGNYASTNGGAIGAGSNGIVITLSDVLFTDNRAALNGGAINHAGGANARITLTNVSFLDNTASAGVGGAISMAGGTLACNVTTGTSLIAGNTASANDNSINFSGNTAAIINTDANTALDMPDAMTGNAANNQTIAITKAGAGIWRIGGVSTFTQAGSGKTNVTVSSGTLQLYRAGQTSATYIVAAAGSLNLAGATSAFTLANGATLLAAGGNTITSGSIVLGASSIISLDLAGAGAGATLLTLNTSAVVNLAANGWTQDLSFLNASALDSIAQNGDIFDLITLGAGSGTFTAASLATLTGNAIGLDPGSTLQLSSGAKTLQLLYGRAINNVLTWTGTASGSWRALNWKTPTLATIAFAQGDILNLDNASAVAGTSTLNIDTTTSATVAGMYLSGSQNHTITGAGIIADATAGSLAGSNAATGKLVLGARASDDATGIDTSSPGAAYTGTLTFANTSDNTSNNFTGGIDIRTGHLVGNAGALGAGIAGITIAATGALTFDQAADATYTSTIHGAGLLTKINAGALTLTANSTFTGTTNINAGSLILSAPAATLGGSINVNANATLAGAGAALNNVTAFGNASIIIGPDHAAGAASASTFTIGGTLALHDAAALKFDLFTANAGDHLVVGSLVFAGADTFTIDLINATSGTYTLITAGNAMISDLESKIHTTQNGATLAGGRIGADYDLLDSDKILQLIINTTNYALTWDNAAAPAIWNATGTNWTGIAGKTFVQGDRVIFADATTAARTIDIAGAVTAADMTVNTGGTHTFTGGAITTDAASVGYLDAGFGDTPTGKLVKTGSGALVFNNTSNSFTGGIDIFAGSITGNADTLAAGAPGITTAASTTLTFDQAADATYSSNITGAGVLIKTNTGNLTLSGTTNHTGATTIAAGTLTLATSNQIAASTAVTLNATLTASGTQTLQNLTGAATGLISGHSTLFILHSTTDTVFAGVIEGSGGIQKTGNATLTLTGENTFTGETNIAQGAIQLGDGSDSSNATLAGPIAIAGNAALLLNRGSANSTIPGAITGGGLMTKTAADTGTLTLTASSAAFTGTTNIAAGDLVLANASLGGQLNLAPGANLSGAGALGNVTALGGNTLTVGLTHSATPTVTATLALTGTLSLAANTTLRYDLAPGGQSDRITAAALLRTGAVTIDINSSLSGTYTLITAAGLDTSATASLITTSNGGALAERARAVYTAGGGNLNLVIITANLANVTWSGTNTALWQDNQPNWRTADGKFLDGDSVTFDDTAAARSVTVDAAGVLATDMLVTTAGTYTFTGGAITTSNTINSTIAPTATGALTIAGPGLVILNNAASDFQGGITVASGTLQGSAATLVTGGIITNNGALVFDQPANATYSSNITGAGALIKTNTGTLTLTNAASAYAGGINVFAGTLELQNSGPATKSAITIAPGAQLRITSDTAYAIAHDITGSGLLSIDTVGNAITTSLALPSAFTGAISLGASTFTLDTAAASLVRNASLHLGPGNTTTVATGTQQTASLTLDGALLNFAATIPADPAASGIINTATLALNSGTIQVTIPAAPAAASTGANLLAQDDGTAVTRLITATDVTGNAGNLTLVDQNNNPIAETTAQSINITQNAATVATGTYNYALTALNGLAVSYKLTALTIAENRTLHLAPDAGATGAAATFTATISGNGNLSIDATNAPVTLAAANNHTGVTTVTGGTLISGAANALGAGPASALILDDTAAFNLNRNTQTLATITTAPTSTLDINAGVLTLQSGGAINGALTGSGTLNITGGNLNITGGTPDAARANTTTAITNIAAGATVTLGDTAALGTAAINLQDTTATLTLAPVAGGTLANPVTGGGVLNIAGSGVTTITRSNNTFTGRATVTGHLVAAHINALGAATTVNVNDTGNLTYTASGALPLSIAGSGTLNLASTTGTLTLTGNNTIAAINALSGANIRANAGSLGTPATRLAMHDATITLAQNDTALGALTMTGASRLAFANIATGTATLASLASTGAGATLAFNTNIATGTSNTLVVTGAITGTYTIVITNTGFPPGSGPATLTLIQSDSNNATYLGSGTLTFGYNPISYAYNIGTTAGGAALTVERAGFGPTGAAIAATSGAMPLTWFAELDSIEKRLGDLRLAPRSGLGKNLWMRASTQRLDINARDTPVPFREDHYNIEVGIDYGGNGGKSGLTVCVGAFAGYGSSTRSIPGMDASGDTSSAHGGAYVTCMASSGWYFDIVGKYNSFKNKISATSDDSPMNARYSTAAAGISIETGKRITLGAGWHITPNAQLAGARINGVQYDAATNTGNLTVGLGSVSTGQVRAGTLFGYRHTAKNGRIIQPYAKLHVARQWTNGGTMTVDAVGYGTPKIQGTRADAGLGVNWMIAKSTQLYLDYEYAWAEDYRKPYGLTAGITCAW